MALNLDRMFYQVICSDDGEAYTPERYLAYMDRETTVQYIATGQAKSLIHVIEFNPVEGTSGIVSEAIAAEVMARWADEGQPLSYWKKEFVEQYFGFEAANAFPRAA
jgi:hypothetical protein